MKTKAYKIIRTNVVLLFADRDKGLEQITPNESQHVRNHSPDGFEFGYSGSGPAQLGLAIMLDYFKSNHEKEPARLAQVYYQTFKERFIATLPSEGGTITATEIEQFLTDENKTSVQAD